MAKRKHTPGEEVFIDARPVEVEAETMVPEKEVSVEASPKMNLDTHVKLRTNP